MRIKIIRIITFILFIFILCGLFYLQILQGNYFYRLSKNNRIRIVPIEGWRGRIKDRNGIILADNRIAYNIVVMPQELRNIQYVFSKLSKILNVKEKVLINKYRKSEKNPFTPVVVAEDILKDEAIIIEENKFDLPGVIIDKNFKRFYPLKKNSSHVIGYIGKVNRLKINRFKEYGYSSQSTMGYSGIEEYYDSFLNGEQGGLQIEINSRGKQVRLLSFKKPAKGQDMTLTIDSNLQDYLDEILSTHTGTIIVMDMTNGEILGMTNHPSYDPNIFMQRKYQRKIAQLLSNTLSPLLNRAIKGVYPPGSVFKVSVAIAGLDTKTITVNTIFNCKGYLELAETRFGCTHIHGAQNLSEALAHSCNVYFYNLGRMLGADTLNKYANILGLGELTDIDLPYENAGFIPNKRKSSVFGKKKWYTGDTLNFAIGQGNVLVTPLQLVKMMSIVAMEGLEVQPHIARSIGGKDLGDHFIKKKVNIKKEIFQEIKKGLRAVVVDYVGTAHVLDIKNLYVAGKTGTAQTIKTKNSHSWFVGYVKSNKNKLAFCVFLEYGGSSQNANIIARELLLYMQKKDMI